ncbi:MAG: DUF2309 family protein, partial [Microbacterium chocolatum]|nr:DUF2309 family protein [Microbacterium chocolatum]
ELGLAGNAAMIIGPREMTRGANLYRRVFLHSYDAALDPEGTGLETIAEIRSIGACTMTLRRSGSCSSASATATDWRGSPRCRSPLCPASTPMPPMALWMVFVPAPRVSGFRVEK